MDEVQVAVDLSSCAEEPIRIPELIQPHGAMLVLDTERRLVRFSLNAQSVLGLSEPLSLGSLLADILSTETMLSIEEATLQLLAQPGQAASHSRMAIGTQQYALCVYRSGAYDVLEFMPSVDDAGNRERFATLRSEIQRLQGIRKLQTKLEFVAQLAKRLTGFDRVMIYQFDADYNGVVSAEAKEPDQESYHGLHYPASDIPSQARALYKENLVRFISDVDYKPCRLTEWSEAPLDMSLGVLRSISPMHIQYMKNMGTVSSLVGSLLSDGELWGLLTCHNRKPVPYNHAQLELFRWLTIYLGNDIEVSSLREKDKKRSEALSVAQYFLAKIRSSVDSFRDLFSGDSGHEILKVTGTDGVACFLDGEFSKSGLVPHEFEVKRIVNKLRSSGHSVGSELFVTHRLPSVLDEPASEHPVSAGVALLPVQDDESAYLIFFREEVVRTVSWAGNPNKAVEQEAMGLTPRSSFRAWKATLNGMSRHWHTEDVEAVQAFGSLIDVELRTRAERELNLLSKCVDTINDTVIITDADVDEPGPRIVFVNQAFEVQTGYSKQEVMGKSPRMLQSSRTSRSTLNLLRKRLTNGAPVRLEFENVSKEDVPYWVEANISPVHDKQGKVTHFTSIQRDITLRRSAEETLRFIAERTWNLERKDFLQDLSWHVLGLLRLPGLIVATSNGENPPSFTSSSFVLDGRLRADFKFSVPEDVWSNDTSKPFFFDNFKFAELEPDSGGLQLDQFRYIGGVWLNDEFGCRDGLILLLSNHPILNQQHAREKLILVQTHVALELVRKKSSDAMWLQANFDVLTGIPNRRMFQDRLAQALKKSSRTGTVGALLLLDLDNFKEINDLYGHAIGDKLLIQVVARLQESLRETDTVARLGGDEFIIILEDLRDFADVSQVAEQILDNMRLAFKLEGHVTYSSFSIGISVFPNDSKDADQLIAFADQAMYAAKKEGKNRFTFFTPQMQEIMHHRAQLASDLRVAVENDQLVLHFQPIIDFATGKIVKAEALLRWQHPTKGLISPLDFIPIAEETGQIIDIGNWVFTRVANYLDYLRKNFDPEFKISINKSPVQFKEDVAKQAEWLEYLNSVGLPPSAIIIEITESSVMDDIEKAAAVLKMLQNEGIEVALDDFGTGYSAMAYLQRYDIDYLKIDQSFVRTMAADSDEFSMVEAIIVMAQKLGIKIVAEGVETEEQARLLQGAGAEFGQGFYFARPMPAHGLEAALLAEKVNH